MHRADVMGYIHLLKDVLQPISKLSLTLQANTTTVAEASELLDVTKETLEGYKDSDCPWLAGFFKEYDTKGTFKEAKLTGKVTSEKFASTRRTLVENLLKAFSSRYADVGEGVVQATEVANFHQWPLPDQKEEIRGKYSHVSMRMSSAKSDLFNLIFCLSIIV